MVMHARKQPRLNDGYADRKDTHLHQDMQYHSGIFADDSDDDGGPIGSRISPRYQNKPSYIERNKEKRGSLSLAEKKVSHYLATGSLGRPIHMDTGFPFSGGGGNDPSAGEQMRSSTSGLPRSASVSSRQPGSSTSSHHHHDQQHRSHQEHNHHAEREKATNNGKQVSSSSSSGKDKEQVQKSAIRVCGDWSEHISSSGKRYYYNCKTEVSQWEKPKEWNSDMCKTPDHSKSKDGRQRTQSTNKIPSDAKASRHSSSSEHQERPTQSHRGNNMDTPDGQQQHHHYHHQQQQPQHPHVRDTRNDSHRDGRELVRDVGRDPPRDTRLGPDRRDSTASNSYHYGVGRSTPSGNNGLSDSQNSDYSKRSGQAEAQMDYKRSGEPLRRRRVDSHGSSQRLHESGSLAPIDDMDISPSASPSSRPSSLTGTPQHLPPTSTPGGHSGTPGPPVRSGSPQGNPIPTLVNRQTSVSDGANYDKTIQTLQELQKALSMHIHMTQQGKPAGPSGANRMVAPNVVGVPPAQPQPLPVLRHAASVPSMSSPAHMMYSGPMQVAPSTPQGYMPGQHLMHLPSLPEQPPPSMTPTTLQGGEDGRTSPVSATSSRSSCGSPTPSDSSSQNAAISSQAMTAAAMKREETAKLTASLSNYYNEKLIGHVLGWQADAVEKQALKLWEESMVNGSLQCSEISVQLKRVRSQVRTAEIQSTLHEQRIMSSDQQRQEIENLKPPSSFLPS